MLSFFKNLFSKWFYGSPPPMTLSVPKSSARGVEKQKKVSVDSQSIKINILPAHNGDTLLISFHDPEGYERNIWIDGGLVKSYHQHHREYLRKMIFNDRSIDLMVVTHVDQDHIGGILAFCNDETFPKDWVNNFWFNSGDLLAKYFKKQQNQSRAISLGQQKSRSINQGISLEDFLEENGNWHTRPVMTGQSYQLSGAKLTILSPSKERLEKLNEEWQEEMESTRAIVDNDYRETIHKLFLEEERPDSSIANGSSIAFLFECGAKRILLLGDAHGDVIAESLKKLGYNPQRRIKLDIVKLSHHASKASNTNELLHLIDCQTFIISTDGSRHGLPNKEALARIVLHPKRNPDKLLNFVFNYDNDILRSVFTEQEMSRYNFRCIFPPNGQEGIGVTL